MLIYRVLKGRNGKKIYNKIPPTQNREKTQSVSKLFACACVHFMRCRVDSRFSLVPFRKKTWGFSDGEFSDGGFSDAYTHTHDIIYDMRILSSMFDLDYVYLFIGWG